MGVDNVAKDLEAAAEQVEGIDVETRARFEKFIISILDMRILPLCPLMRLCSMIDRSNMGLFPLYRRSVGTVPDG